MGFHIAHESRNCIHAGRTFYKLYITCNGGEGDYHGYDGYEQAHQNLYWNLQGLHRNTSPNMAVPDSAFGCILHMTPQLRISLLVAEYNPPDDQPLPD